MAVGWLEVSLVLVCGACGWYGATRGLAVMILQVGGTLLGLSVGQWLAFGQGRGGTTGLPGWLFGGLAVVSATLAGTLLGMVVARLWGVRLAKWAPRSDFWGGAALGALVGLIIWGILLVGLLSWSWHPWSRAVEASVAAHWVLRFMPLVYEMVETAYPSWSLRGHP